MRSARDRPWRGKGPGEQLKRLFNKVGSRGTGQENFRLTRRLKAGFTEKMKAGPVELVGSVGRAAGFESSAATGPAG